MDASFEVKRVLNATPHSVTMKQIDGGKLMLPKEKNDAYKIRCDFHDAGTEEPLLGFPVVHMGKYTLQMPDIEYKNGDLLIVSSIVANAIREMSPLEFAAQTGAKDICVVVPGSGPGLSERGAGGDFCSLAFIRYFPEGPRTPEVTGEGLEKQPAPAVQFVYNTTQNHVNMEGGIGGDLTLPKIPENIIECDFEHGGTLAPIYGIRTIKMGKYKLKIPEALAFQDGDVLVVSSIVGDAVQAMNPTEFEEIFREKAIRIMCPGSGPGQARRDDKGMIVANLMFIQYQPRGV